MKKKYIFIAIAAMLFFLQQKQKTEKSIVAIVLVETLSTSLKMFYIEKRLLMTKKYEEFNNPKEINVAIDCNTGAILSVSSANPALVNFLISHESGVKLLSYISHRDTTKFRAEVAQLKELKLI